MAAVRASNDLSLSRSTRANLPDASVHMSMADAQKMSGFTVEMAEEPVLTPTNSFYADLFHKHGKTFSYFPAKIWTYFFVTDNH